MAAIAGALRHSMGRILMFSYEFTCAPFSGNGVLARSLVKGLLKCGVSVIVLCAKPAAEDSSADNHIAVPEISEADAQRLSVFFVQLPPSALWRRLDRSAPWQNYADGCANFAEKARDWMPTAVLPIDWHGAAAHRVLARAAWPATRAPPVVYCNFRVYASGDAADAEWLNVKEREALRGATIVVALSAKDRTSLAALLAPEAAPSEAPPPAAPPPIELLLPPLRADIEAKTSLGEAAHTAALEALLPGSEDEKARVLDAVSKAKDGRRFLTCAVRLSREKMPERFVELMESLAPHLARLGLTPLLCGAAADAEYAAALKARLRAAVPAAVVIDTFLDPPALAAVFAHTALNVHPSQYDAYGMTIVEAAAFAAPTLLPAGGGVGASRLLPTDAGASLEADFGAGATALAAEVVALLEAPADLRSVGMAAQKRALAWGEEAYGQELHKLLVRAAGGHSTAGDDDAVADGCIRPRSSDRKRKAKSFGAGMVRYHDD